MLCKWWDFDPGCYASSNDTPGDAWSELCSKDHGADGWGWRLSGTSTTTDELRKQLLTAETCPDFEEVP